MIPSVFNRDEPPRAVAAAVAAAAEETGVARRHHTPAARADAAISASPRKRGAAWLAR